MITHACRPSISTTNTIAVYVHIIIFIQLQYTNIILLVNTSIFYKMKIMVYGPYLDEYMRLLMMACGVVV